MIPISIKEIREAVDGELLWGQEEGMVTNVVTDSRKAGEGSLFVPIVGERVDAHQFIPQVMEAGAALTFTSKKEGKPEKKGSCIYVENTLTALQKTAAYYRSKFDIPVIGVTGSVGKTTTKEMISTVLEKKYRVLKTQGNLNSQIGVALMMFELEPDIQIGIFEMGMSLPGEMEKLVEIVKPQTAVMTNIGVSHIGNLGSREKIAEEKGHIVKYVGSSHDGKLYICGNGDMKQITGDNIPYSLCVAECPICYYGTEEGCEVFATDLKVTDVGQSFVYHGNRETGAVELSVMGSHNVNNALVALALSEQLEVPFSDALQALKEYHPFSMRGERKDAHGYHVIDDTYNASPDSINSNIDALFDYGKEGQKIAVLGDVLELGEQSEKLHRGIGDFILKEAESGKRLSYLITVGEGASYIGRQVQEHSDISVEFCRNNEEAARIVKQCAKPGDWILIKGSRGMHMDEVVEKVVM